MRQFAKISPTFWTGKLGRSVRSLGLDVQLIALYLMSSPHTNMIGIYYLPMAYVAHDTGLSTQAITQAMSALTELGFCRFDPESEYLWIRDLAFEQIGPLKSADKRVKAIREQYMALPDLPFLADFFEQYQTLFHLTIKRTHDALASADERPSLSDNAPLASPSTLPTQRAPAKALTGSSMDDPTRDKTDVGSKAHTVSSLCVCVEQNGTTLPLVHVFEHWKTVMQHPKAQLDHKRKQLIQKALKAGYSVTQLCDAITGCSITPHNMGDNERGQRYDGLHVILRDGDQIDRFIRNHQHPPTPRNEANRRLTSNLHTLQQWVDRQTIEENTYDSE